jgi:hypothetical protein
MFKSLLILDFYKYLICFTSFFDLNLLKIAFFGPSSINLHEKGATSMELKIISSALLF